MILIEKSNENLEIALCAENKEYYDVAVSRFYYSIYQKILYYLDKTQMKIDENKKKDKGSHDAIIQLMTQHVNLFHKEGIESISYLRGLKLSRKKADYDGEKIKKIKYKEIKENYEEINNFLDILLNKNI